MKSLSNTDGRVLADRLRQARRAARLSQAQLAQGLGVASSAVAQWESPTGTKPRLEKLPGIAAAVGVTVEWLLTGQARPQEAAPTIDAGEPAIAPDSFARDMDEEMLLRQFRRLPQRTRGLFIGLLGEFGTRR
jgi:transcriptional regulator with XRE-family HTH domain